ncbi:hypothetical protein ADO04_01112 [Streptococcus parauberis]|nr:hypothetical protein AKL13_00405 [Streptococcus parauberis]KYP21172.1 hypothetical protein TN39_00328 [Streptococcus parauberis]KYP22432.1 hypothetical protein AKL14_00434 [Streptococcus parauberis]KYP24831.1 hypothetical protein ADO04_01112 [Streptococcus parauberis]KYP25808.1 hypothetical protein TP84_01181 [Streptococcus parauberis]
MAIIKREEVHKKMFESYSFEKMYTIAVENTLNTMIERYVESEGYSENYTIKININHLLHLSSSANENYSFYETVRFANDLVDLIKEAGYEKVVSIIERTGAEIQFEA